MKKDYDEKEIIEMLENVVDSYDDFVIGVCNSIMHHPEIKQQMIDFILDDPTRDTGDILEYYLSIVEPQKLVFIDDDGNEYDTQEEMMRASA